MSYDDGTTKARSSIELSLRTCGIDSRRASPERPLSFSIRRLLVLVVEEQEEEEEEEHTRQRSMTMTLAVAAILPRLPVMGTVIAPLVVTTMIPVAIAPLLGAVRVAVLVTTICPTLVGTMTRTILAAHLLPIVVAAVIRMIRT